MNDLKKGLKNIEKEVDYVKTKLDSPHDRFVTVMQDFCTVASYNFIEVEEAYTEMREKVRSMEWYCMLTTYYIISNHRKESCIEIAHI